ncbi:hypothetical protein F5Y01DRAFT_329616 [Xylaria sp. FL0043]|nr:hypothetical protein F5Y01DRAFT_329616 [Xylaria sp. FL0043]
MWSQVKNISVLKHYTTPDDDRVLNRPLGCICIQYPAQKIKGRKDEYKKTATRLLFPSSSTPDQHRFFVYTSNQQPSNDYSHQQHYSSTIDSLQATPRSHKMQFTTIVALAFAALAAATPSTPLKNHGSSSSINAGEPKLVTFVMTEPDCGSLKDYCTHCNGDFNCETDPRCEWCYENDQFGN